MPEKKQNFIFLVKGPARMWGLFSVKDRLTIKRIFQILIASSIKHIETIGKRLLFPMSKATMYSHITIASLISFKVNGV